LIEGLFGICRMARKTWLRYALLRSQPDAIVMAKAVTNGVILWARGFKTGRFTTPLWTLAAKDYMLEIPQATHIPRILLPALAGLALIRGN